VVALLGLAAIALNKVDLLVASADVMVDHVASGLSSMKTALIRSYSVNWSNILDTKVYGDAT
jgi:hypothetical protein